MEDSSHLVILLVRKEVYYGEEEKDCALQDYF
jgi:hypothetical protein